MLLLCMLANGERKRPDKDRHLEQNLSQKFMPSSRQTVKRQDKLKN
ncbi:hypothetical protein PJF56_21235 [Roseofilum sp. BLCC_M91]|uniref:Uncharacterized protein n=1 Tax=Roseofilum halophilum BLCC-M91 TaxID=3022259 RepID=A0ABT7BQB4_9CYAN|nr:hypothetical protein [Roseofilum halophilum]MDJ1181392.1 hypothetical protein [Roseofilum halophilum BLCC-M91]